MEKEKKENCEKIKGDKQKREFIKKSLLGIGTAGIIAGVLASPLGSSITEIGDLNPGTNHVANLDVDKLDSQTGSYYRCSGCTWTCATTCSSACATTCTGACRTCTGCSTECDGCSGP
jgi:hypothetical protein